MQLEALQRSDSLSEGSEVSEAGANFFLFYFAYAVSC